MSLRFKALNNIAYNNTTPTVESSWLCENHRYFRRKRIYPCKTARAFLSDEAYKSLVASIKGGKKIDRSVANQIAAGIRQWAETKGVTHYTHWFQPLNRYHCRKT